MASVVPPDHLDTTEVRWFVTGELPESLVDWFIRSGRATLEVRTDAYLVDGSHDAGRKRRDHGAFEVKLRTGSQGLFHLGNGVRSRIEEWKKYLGLQTPPDPTWVDVGKVVLTRTYQLDAEDAVSEVRVRDMLTPGCDVELATVSVGDTKAWTFAFEVWGPEDRRLHILAETASRFVADSGLPLELTLALTSDMGYPEWLAALDITENGSGR
jgi:hypothetical protein